VRFDPKTEQFQTWIIPSGGGMHICTIDDDFEKRRALTPRRETLAASIFP
jgi:hypothetical protein